MNKILITVLSIIMIVCSAYAEVINGAASVNEKKLKTLEINGSATFKDLKIDEFMIINGSASGKNLQVKKLKVSGSLTTKYMTANDVEVSGAAALREVVIKNSLIVDGSLKTEHIRVQGKTVISGGLKASNGSFDSIEISSDRAELAKSRVNNIYFFNSNNRPQILELKSGTVVSGNVIFKSGKGKVYLFDGSKVEGKVEGGEVIKK